MLATSSRSEVQEHAEQEVDSFRKNLGPFVVAAEKTRMPMAFTNSRNKSRSIIFANQSLLRLTGYSREEMLGKSLGTFIEESSGGPTADHVVDQLNGSPREGDLPIQFLRKDGTTFWASMFSSPVFDKSGKVVQHFLSFVDLTERREEQAHAHMLIDELQHRVKNTLATVQSIISEAMTLPLDHEELREAIESRVFALARSHDLLTRVSWEGAGLREIIDAALEPFSPLECRASRFVIAGEDVRLASKMTLALGIAFHELATNAVKYGALSIEAGSVEIAWSLHRADRATRLVISWQEMNGPAVVVPARRGFGTKIIERGLAHELGAVVHLDFAPAGVHCVIDIPAPTGASNG